MLGIVCDVESFCLHFNFKYDLVFFVVVVCFVCLFCLVDDASQRVICAHFPCNYIEISQSYMLLVMAMMTMVVMKRIWVIIMQCEHALNCICTRFVRYPCRYFVYV